MFNRQDLHLFAVFGHGAAGNLDVGLVQFFGDGIVAERFARIFIPDQSADMFPDGFGRNGGFTLSGNGSGEEVFELGDALRGVDILVGGDPA